MTRINVVMEGKWIIPIDVEKDKVKEFIEEINTKKINAGEELLSISPKHIIVPNKILTIEVEG